MAHYQCNLAKEAGRLVDWQGKVWSRRYDGIVVSDEPEVQWKRLKYVLAGGVKEGLAESPIEWPGLFAPGRSAERLGGEPRLDRACPVIHFYADLGRDRREAHERPPPQGGWPRARGSTT